MRERINKICTLVMVGLISFTLFFVPLVTSNATSDYSEWPKALFFLGGIVLALGVWFVQTVIAKELTYTKFFSNWFLVVLVGLYFISSLASRSRFISFFGEVNGFRLPFFLFCGLAVLVFILTQIITSRRLRNLVLLAFTTGYGLALAQLVIAVTPLRNIFGSIATRPVLYSQVFDSLMFAPTLLLVGASILYARESSLVERIVGGAVFGLGAIILFVFGGTAATIVAVLGLVIFIGYGFKYPEDVVPKTVWVFLGTTIVLLTSFFIPARALFKVSTPSEVTLDLPVSSAILGSSISASAKTLLIGSGPNTFRFLFSEFRPLNFNYTTLWQSRFIASGSAVMEMVGSVGVLGSVVLVVFLTVLLAKVLRQLHHAGRIVQFDKFEVRPERGALVGSAVVFLAATYALFVSGGGVAMWVAWFFIVGYLLVLLAVPAAPQLEVVRFTTTHRRAGVFGFLGLLLAGVTGLLVLTFYRVHLADKLLVASGSAPATMRLALLERALELNPERVDLYNALTQLELGMLSPSTGNSTEGSRHLVSAMQVAERATAELPNDIRAWEQLGATYLAAAPTTGEAGTWLLTVAKRAIQLEPTNPVWYVLMGDVESSLGHFDNALAAYKNAITLKNDWNVPYVKLAALYGRAGKTDEAIAVLSEGLPISLTDPDYLYLLGVTYFNRNKTSDTNAAIEFFTAALQIDPSKQEALFALGAAYEQLKNYPEALTVYQRLLALKPTDINVLKRLAAVRAKVRVKN